MIYTVVDIETTGKGIRDNRITEICIVRTDGEKVLDKFVSLINPRRRIPSFITGLTGIDDNMLRDAPPFEEVAERIVEITEGAVFVAHNVNFDYPIVRSEFRALGYDFKRKKLCTVRLAKKLMPGKFSYSLGRLCSTLGIPIFDRHRAEGDTDATVILLHRLLSLDTDGKVFASHLNGRNKELAANVDREMISGLPQRPGVYYFKDSKGQVIYVGKAVRIRERVLGHFYGKNNKEYELCQSTASIDFTETGNELIALLLEADEIRKYFPRFNVVQKKTRLPYCIVHYVNRKGIVQFGLDRKSALDLGARPFFRREEAVAKLEEICREFRLCPKFTGLQRIRGGCAHFRITECNGICRGGEDPEIYNVRAREAVVSLNDDRNTYAILESGRKDGEQGFIMVKDGIYHGYGFFDISESIDGFGNLENFLVRRKNTYHTTRIIASYLNKYPNSVQFKTMNEGVSMD